MFIVAAQAPSILSRRGPIYNVYDVRGPIPLNMQATQGRVGNGDGKAKMVDVRTVAYTRDNVLVKPTQSYMEKWLPQKLKL